MPGLIKKVLIAKEQGVLKKKIRRKLKRYFRVLTGKANKSCKYWYKHTTLQNNKVMFLTFQGKYTCNPKYICDEIIRQKLDWDLVWVVNDLEHISESEFPSQVRLVQKNTPDYYRELYSAHIWVDNAFCAVWKKVIKRPEQVYIETLHGSLGIKKIGPEDVNDEKRNHRGYRCGRLADYCISNSSFETEVYRSSFWPETEILEYGHARNDFLLTKDESLIKKTREKVHKFFSIPEDVNVAMYAPTFREKGIRGVEEQIEEINFKVLKKALVNKFGGKWEIICRTHTRDVGKREAIENIKGIYDGATYPDMQELILGVEVGITDYSSWIFDYVLLKKPGFIYAPDLKYYDVERGFYYPLKSTPFPLGKSNTELKKVIEEFDNEKFLKDVEKFLEEKGCIEDGQASKRIVQKMREIMEV
ncbi:MAG: CDP-glycerol--glycerophosphate glycerophosphotransferase, partial [Lachnospiraceae bacterium]|nr:CDP-glycerol--glycerophosphate glycerophosphotransferase [Lachnospiraceae bacterium]